MQQLEHDEDSKVYHEQAVAYYKARVLNILFEEHY